jgi:hypothetical protein
MAIKMANLAGMSKVRRKPITSLYRRAPPASVISRDKARLTETDPSLPWNLPGQSAIF